jgi:hypothetical protein
MAVRIRLAQSYRSWPQLQMAGPKWLTIMLRCPRLALADVANRGRHGRRSKSTDDAGHNG